RIQPKVKRKANQSTRAILAATGSIKEARNVREASNPGARLRDCTLWLNATSPGQGPGCAWTMRDATRMIMRPIAQQVIPAILRVTRPLRRPRLASVIAPAVVRF